MTRIGNVAQQVESGRLGPCSFLGPVAWGQININVNRWLRGTLLDCRVFTQLESEGAFTLCNQEKRLKSPRIMFVYFNFYIKKDTVTTVTVSHTTNTTTTTSSSVTTGTATPAILMPRMNGHELLSRV
jgi:hypothetical protein